MKKRFLKSAWPRSGHGVSSPRRVSSLLASLCPIKRSRLVGLEVAFIVITLGSSAATTLAQKSSGIASATIGAAVAGLLVILAGALVRAPLTKVPENTLKFVVGLMLTTFGSISGRGGIWCGLVLR